jgi:hypothetical protein
VDAEFINVFISKQKNLIDDLLSKNIMLETKLAVSEMMSAKYKDQVDKQAIDIEEKGKYINRLVDQINALQRKVVDLEQTKKEEVKPNVKKKKTDTSPDTISVAADEF